MTTRTGAAHTLALMARVARVREIQAKQALAEAIERKNAQQERTREAHLRADRSDVALQAALEGAVVDLARLPLLQELSAHVQAMLADENAQLTECEQRVGSQASVSGKRARLRERLEEKAAIVSDDIRQADEARQLEFATEVWLVRRATEGP
ncbi:hypothetical protein [Fulvimonas yonginensis]|uniref:Flagellar FliJ protein n=1 Tax=Fulvimonas yonginensis TaxID=1495200 RepID=A0ABU8JDW6_9GAMM